MNIFINIPDEHLVDFCKMIDEYKSQDNPLGFFARIIENNLPYTKIPGSTAMRLDPGNTVLKYEDHLDDIVEFGPQRVSVHDLMTCYNQVQIIKKEGTYPEDFEYAFESKG